GLKDGYRTNIWWRARTDWRGGQIRHVAAVIGTAIGAVFSDDDKHMPKLRHRGRGVHGERGCIAGHVSRHVADHDDELRAVIGRSRWRRRVRRGSCAANRRSVFVPLIAQRTSSVELSVERKRAR